MLVNDIQPLGPDLQIKQNIKITALNIDQGFI